MIPRTAPQHRKPASTSINVSGRAVPGDGKSHAYKLVEFIEALLLLFGFLLQLAFLRPQLCVLLPYTVNAGS